MRKKKGVRSKGSPRKVEVGLKSGGELSRKRWGCKLPWVGSIEKKSRTGVFFSFARIDRKTPVLRLAIYSIQISLCGLRSTRYQGRGEPDSPVVNLKRAADGRR